MMASASTEQDYPGPLYLLLILHYVEQECRSERQDIRPATRRWNRSALTLQPTTSRNFP